MKKDPIKHSIIKWFDERNLLPFDDGFVFAGSVGRAVHDLTKAKESIIERRMRELCREGKLESDYKQVNGKGPRCVRYKLKLPTDPQDLRKHYTDMGRIQIQIVEENGVRIAREVII